MEQLNYIFKLTPNDREVVINSQVLSDGYDDVKYPIMLRDTTKLGYIQDNTTFKFIDLSTFNFNYKPYPIDMTISLVIKNARFYAANCMKSNNNIIFNTWNKSDCYWENHDEYDEFIVNKNYVKDPKNYHIEYSLSVCIYWSDGKSHINSDDVKNSIINANSFTIRLFGNLIKNEPKPTGFNYSSYNTELFDYEVNPQKSEDSFTIDIPYTDSDKNGFNKCVMLFPDSFSLSEKQIANVYAQSTFIDPVTKISVTSRTRTVMKQDPYPGPKKGYLKTSFVDTVPVDVWAPTITPIYAQSENDEANNKVDPLSFTEYYAFIVHGVWKIDPDNYKQINQLYYQGVLSSEKLQITNNEDELIKHLYIIDSSGNQQNILQEQIDSSYIKNAFTYESVTLSNFYKDEIINGNYDTSVFLPNDVSYFDNKFNKFNIYGDKKLNLNTVITYIDIAYQQHAEKKIAAKKIINRFIDDPINNQDFLYKFPPIYESKTFLEWVNEEEKKQFTEESESTEEGESTEKLWNTDSSKINFSFQTSKNDSLVNLIITDGLLKPQTYDISSEESPTSFLPDNNIRVFGCLRAIYANYIIKDNKYVQVLNTEPIDGDENTYYIDIDNDKQYHTIEDYYNIWGDEYHNERKHVFEGDTIYSYKIVTDEHGNSVQYKQCINSLIDDGGQVPVYGLYPILSGFIPTMFNIYDYEQNYLVPAHEITSNILERTLGGATIDSSKLNKEFEQIEELLVNPEYDPNNPEIDDSSLDSSMTDDSSTNEGISSQYLDESDEDNSSIITYSDDINQEIVYGASSDTYKIQITLNDANIRDYLYINGVNLSLLNTDDNVTFTMTSTVDPGLFIITLDESYPREYIEPINVTVYKGNSPIIQGLVLITNSENEKHLTNFENKGKDIGNEYSSYMLLRTNPKLTGNIKMVIDTDYNLYLDTFKVNAELSNHKFRKYPISNEGNYPRDVKKVFKSIPTSVLFDIPSNSLDPHKVYTDFNDQYETIYEYGAETNKDNLYSENMKILAPLHLGNNVPEYFAIFKYSLQNEQDILDKQRIDDIDKFKNLLSDSEIIITYDLRTHTSIGQYLHNYQEMLTNYGQCYLQFIEQDYDKNSTAYRQGTNIWKGVSVKRGILTDQSETTYFASKILNSDIANKQEVFNDFIMQGFERNNLLYPNIINLEFMFNDEDEEEYSMHRYFGLYLTANEFIKYGYIVSNDNKSSDNKYIKYDVNGNVFIGDNDIFNTIFKNEYSDRLFYAITNTDVKRVTNISDVDAFINNCVNNKPDENLVSLKSGKVLFDDTEKSFITLHFTKPLHYGEHIKFIALNYVSDHETYINFKDNEETSQLPYEHIVYEIIASNDIRLKDTDGCISPYITTNKCIYSENTYFYRISFYSQDYDFPDVPATIEEQIKRIISCIEKFDTFIKVSSFDNNSIAFISEHDEMYLQHIDVPSFEDFKYDYMLFDTMLTDLYTTNKDINDSISFMLTDGDISYVNHYNGIDDNENDWISNVPDKLLTDEKIWNCYVEAEDPDNIKIDTISYFNKECKYNMHALSCRSNYFDGYYAAFSNYCFESLGWRYNTVVKFQETSVYNYNYVVYSNIHDIIKDVKYPLVYNVSNMYDTLNTYQVKYGYLRNNIINPENYENYTTKQQFIFDELQLHVISSPYDVTNSMIASKNDVLLDNNEIHLYKPKSSQIALMGISNIADIDTVIDLEQSVHMQNKLNIKVDAQTSVLLDESDYRIQHGVMYEVVSGDLYIKGLTDLKINQGVKFIVFPYNSTYAVCVEGFDAINETTSIYAGTDVVYKLCDKQHYQIYDYVSNIPEIMSTNLYKNPGDDSGMLLYPIVPSVNCNWKSTGNYYDFNNVLNVNMLKFDYEHIGNFTENIYTPDVFLPNQYVTNKIDDTLYIDGKNTTFRTAILNKELQYPIKKLLINKVNINTSAVFYNANIQSIEFIFYGIKFIIKLNSKIVNSYIHLDDYSGFRAFVINDYNSVKRNELFISIEEQFILLINHQFYIEYEHEAANNIKKIGDDYEAYAPYAVLNSPFNIDFISSGYTGKAFQSYKSDKSNNLHKSLMSVIDKFNLWSSLFVQYDIPDIVHNDMNKPHYIQSYIETIGEYNDYVTFGNTFNNYTNKIGLFNDDYNVMSPDSTFTISDVISSVSHSLVITKADGNYNKITQDLINSINENVENIITNIVIEENQDIADGTIQDSSVIEEYMDDFNINLYEILLNNAFTKSSDITTISMSQSTLDELKTFIRRLIVTETNKDKLLRYCKSVDDNMDIYIIPEESEPKYIKNTDTYNPLIFNLTVPNNIKYNYGWFTPNTNNMMTFDIDDELQYVLNIDLLRANTKILDIAQINNYTGNKIYEDSTYVSVNKNYFNIKTRSLLNTTWDYGYYRLYTNETDYVNKDGHITGIDDKSFFGSRCMVIHSPYLLLNKWSYPTSNDLYSMYVIDSKNNVNSKNIKCMQIQINLTSVIYNYFINNDAFKENWNKYKNTQNTGMYNYINNIISTYYNLNSDIDIELFAVDKELNKKINMFEEEPSHFDFMYVYENYSTNIENKNGSYILTIIINQDKGMDIFPTVKIYRK